MFCILFSFEIQSILKQKSTGKRSVAPYIAMLLNVLLSTYFGYFIGDTTINLVNGINVVIVVANSCVFFAYYPQKWKLRDMLLSIVVALVTVVTVSHSLAGISENYRMTFLGVASNLATILMFLSPIANIVSTLTTLHH
jgi:hypothetical protein